MAKRNSKEKFEVQGLFQKIQRPQSLSKREESFKEDLRQKVLADYNNINDLSMEKKTIFSSLAKLGAGIAALVVAVYVGTTLVPKDLFNKNLGLELAFKEGVVEYQRDGVWATANLDTSFKQGDGIRVSDDGKAIINFDDGSALRMNNGSAVILSSLNPEHVVVTSTVGEVYARVTKSENRQFVVEASGVEYVAMGTAYRVTETDYKKGVEVFASKVKVKDGKEDVIVEQGKKYFVVDKDFPELEKKITQIVKDEDLKDDSFIDWNKTVDEKSDEYKDDLGIFEDTEAPNLKITSPKNNYTTTSSKVTIKGEVDQDSTLYKNGHLIEHKDGKFSVAVSLKKGTNTYNFKAIDPAGNKAKVTSKVVRKDPAPKPTPKPSVYISIWNKGGQKVGWKTVGFTSSKGFKVVWSKNSGPTYPNRSGDDYQYHGSSSATYSNKLTAFSGEGYYYVRVCEYLGGKCGRYSGQIKMYLK